MSINENVVLTIAKDHGISHAIDDQLDKELGQDVKLKLAEWNSVFALVKEDKAKDTKQYSGGDDSITNNKNYVVQEGTYEITQNTWTQIVNIAKQSLGIEVKTEEVQEEEIIKNDNKIEKNVKTLLAQNAQNFDFDSLSEDVKSKLLDLYKTITEYSNQNGKISDENIATRLVAYATALTKKQNSTLNDNTLEIHEDIFADYLENGEENTVPKEIIIDNSSTENLKQDLLKKSSYILNYDTNGDSKLQFDEYLSMEMSGDNSTDISDEIKSLYQNSFKKLDINKDGGIDNSEMASYYATMATINDTEKTGGTWNNITYDEWKEAQTRLADNTDITDYLPPVLLQQFNEVTKKNGKMPTPEELFPAENKEYDEARQIYTDWYKSAQLKNRMKGYYDGVFKES